MTYWSDIGLAPQDQLRSARVQIHKAMQWVTMAARANIPAWPDDGQSNLGWDHDQNVFTSHPFTQKDNDELIVTLSPAKLELGIARKNSVEASFPLNRKTEQEVSEWLDAQLSSAGYKTASNIELPYKLDQELLDVKIYDTSNCAEGLLEFEKWFGASDLVLNEIIKNPELQAYTPGPSPVRTWPHHIDIASYIQLEDGEFEKARGIGVGMAAGDKNCQEPYFYCYPWPKPDPEDLPKLETEGCYWNTSGYIGTILPRSQVLQLTNREQDVQACLEDIIQKSRTLLGIS